MAAAVADPREDIDSILGWIGFDEEGERESIMDEAFEDWEDLYSLRSGDISDLAKSFAKRDPNERIVFGLKRTKRLKNLVLWVQDFYRCGEDNPTIEDLDEASFLAALTTTSERYDVRQSLIDQADSSGREASPGKFKNEKKWKSWVEALRNYLSTQIGAAGVPLSYVIRERATPDDDDKETEDFIEKTILCAPHTGPQYEADRRKVHQTIWGFVQGETAETWIRKNKGKKNGRLDYQDLMDHYNGVGNTNRQVADADNLRDTLHYKSERAFPWESFIRSAEEMFDIYEMETANGFGDDDDKIRWLLPRVQHPELQQTVEAIEAENSIRPATYQWAIDLLGAKVGKLPSTVALRARNISAVGTARGGDDIYNADGSIKTGYYENFKQLSQESQRLVIEERKRLGNKFPSKQKHNNNNKQQHRIKQVKKMQRELKKMRRKVAAIKKRQTTSDEEKSDDETDDGDDAGNQFGGRDSMQSNKKKSKRK